MSWVKIDDGFSGHRKFRRAEPDGVALFVAGLCYCARHATDGRIGKDELIEVYPWGNLRAEKVAQRLVDTGLWEDHGDFWMVHDYAEYNETKEEIREKKAQAAARQRKRRDKLRGLTEPVTRDSRVSHGVGHANGHAVTDSVSHADRHAHADHGAGAPSGHGLSRVSHTTPSRPVPTRPEEEREITRARTLDAFSDDDELSRTDVERLGFPKYGALTGTKGIEVVRLCPMKAWEFRDAFNSPGESWGYFAKVVVSIRQRQAEPAPPPALPRGRKYGYHPGLRPEEFVDGEVNLDEI